jgi:hypothetical protein
MLALQYFCRKFMAICSYGCALMNRLFVFPGNTSGGRKESPLPSPVLRHQGSSDKGHDRVEDDNDILGSNSSLSQHSSMGNLSNVEGQVASCHTSPSMRLACSRY